MNRIPFLITLETAEGEKEFVQFHFHRDDAIAAGETILKREYPLDKGSVKSARMLSGIETDLLYAGNL